MASISVTIVTPDHARDPDFSCRRQTPLAAERPPATGNVQIISMKFRGHNFRQSLIVSPSLRVLLLHAGLRGRQVALAAPRYELFLRRTNLQAPLRNADKRCTTRKHTNLTEVPSFIVAWNKSNIASINRQFVAGSFSEQVKETAHSSTTVLSPEQKIRSDEFGPA